MRTTSIICASFILLVYLGFTSPAFAQEEEHAEFAAEGLDEGVEIAPELPEIEGEPIEEEEGKLIEEEKPLEEPELIEEVPAEENRWHVKINAAIRANYVFNNSPDSFLVKYRFTVEGQANAATAVISGSSEINAEVEGFLAKWPTGECRLDITIPRAPFELTFNRSGEDKGSISLKFKQRILENWKSKCSFTDAPGARFETMGEPEKWLTQALDKARPPLRSIVTDITDEETTTSFVITKEIVDDPPLGSVEIEGTGVITVTPGSAE
ncbi:MAG: hypothetical protein ABH871_06040 [Pseudomonadota bacterium]